MIDAAVIGEILTVYAKHGWLLRRVLLTAELKQRLKESVELLLADASLFESEMDALWFSRPPQTGGVVWEIRHLSDVPFALLENIDEMDAEFESALHAVEKRLRENIEAKNRA